MKDMTKRYEIIRLLGGQAALAAIGGIAMPVPGEPGAVHVYHLRPGRHGSRSFAVLPRPDGLQVDVWRGRGGETDMVMFLVGVAPADLAAVVEAATGLPLGSATRAKRGAA